MEVHLILQQESSIFLKEVMKYRGPQASGNGLLNWSGGTQIS
jgi:hypothetical protein